MDDANHAVTLVGPPPELDVDLDSDLAATSVKISRQTSVSVPVTIAKDSSKPPLTIVLLLPDGRWQELALNRLEFRVLDNKELHMWSEKFLAATERDAVRSDAVSVLSGDNFAMGSDAALLSSGLRNERFSEATNSTMPGRSRAELFRMNC